MLGNSSADGGVSSGHYHHGGSGGPGVAFCQWSCGLVMVVDCGS